MWIASSIGFFSVVDKHDMDSEDVLTIRARCKSDLLALRALYLPDASAIETSSDTDYRYRVRAPRTAVSGAMSALVADITYSNFKQHVSSRQSSFHLKAYHQAWSSFYSIQQAQDAAEWLDESWWQFPSSGPMPAPEEVICVLKVGFEGGSRTLMAELSEGTWWLWETTKESYPNGEEHQSTSAQQKTMSLPDALQMLYEDAAWFMGYPLEIHPWFTRRILLAKEHFHG